MIDDVNHRHPAFAEDLANDLHDRRFRRAFRRASLRIAVVDVAVNAVHRLSRRRATEG